MKRVAIVFLDLLFCLAYVGLVAVVISIFTGLIGALFFVQPQRELLTDNYQLVFKLTAILWIILSFMMMALCYNKSVTNEFQGVLWRRILLIQGFLVVGAIAYYIGYLRRKCLPNINNDHRSVLKANRVFLDILYFISFWGFLLLILIVGIFFTVSSEEFIELLMIIGFLLIPAVAISAMTLEVILLVDAASRPAERWQEVNFLKFLNPWSSVFGIRKYYLDILRPELL